MSQKKWLALAAAVAACGGSRDARLAGSEAMATDSALLAASTGAADGARVAGVMIGRRIGAGNRVIEPTFEFAPTDTVYLSVAMHGTGGDRALTAAWRSQTGEIVQQSSQPAAIAGENAAFRLTQEKGLRPGTYKVVLFHGEDSVDNKVFVVRK